MYMEKALCEHELHYTGGWLISLHNEKDIFRSCSYSAFSIYMHKFWILVVKNKSWIYAIQVKKYSLLL